MDFSYYFPRAAEEFPGFFHFENEKLYRYLKSNIGWAIRHNGDLRHWRNVLIGYKNVIAFQDAFNIHYERRLETTEIGGLFIRFIDSIRENLENGLRKYPEDWGFPLVTLGEDIWKRVKQHALGAATNAVGLVVGNYAGKAVKSATTIVGRGSEAAAKVLTPTFAKAAAGSHQFVAKQFAQTTADVIGGIAIEGAKKGVEQGVGSDNSTNFFHVVSGPEILSEGGQTAFKVVDVVTDFVPIVGNVKSLINLGHNIVCLGGSLLSYFEAKEAQEKINDRIKKENQILWSAMKEDFGKMRAHMANQRDFFISFIRRFGHEMDVISYLFPELVTDRLNRETFVNYYKNMDTREVITIIDLYKNRNLREQIEYGGYNEYTEDDDDDI